MFFFNKKSLLEEKLAAEHTLTDENLKGMVEEAGPITSPKEQAASAYERVRNMLAVATAEFGAKETLNSLSTNHGKLFRLLDLEDEAACDTFLAHCEELERHTEQYVAFLREERWYNSQKV